MQHYGDALSREAMSDNDNQALKGARSAGALRLFQLFSGFVSIVVLARLLGPEAYGVFGAAMVIIGFGQLFTTVWGGAYVAMPDAGDADFDALAWLSIFSGGLAALFALATAGLLADVEGFDKASILLPALSLVLLVGTPVVFLSAAAQRQGRYDLLAQSELYASALSVVLGIALAFAGYGVWTFVAMELTRTSVRLAVLAARLRVWPRLRCRKADLLRAARFDGTRLGSRTLQWADQAVPRLLIARFLGEDALGLFVLGWRVYTQLKEVVVGPFAMFAMPAIASARGDRQAVHHLLDSWQRLSAFLAFPAVIGFVLICPLLVEVWLDERWSNAAIVMQLLALSALRSASSAFNGAVLEGMGAPRLQMLTQAAGLAATLVLVPVGLMAAGIVGVAAATVLRSFLTWPIGAIFVARVSGYLPVRQVLVVLPAAAAAAIMSFAILIVLGLLPEGLSAWVQLSAGLCTGLAAYGAASVMVQPADQIRFLRLLTRSAPPAA